MARVNTEDGLTADYRFRKLTRLLGNEDTACGMLNRFWRIAQDFWGQEMTLMPWDIFEGEGFQPILECGLAEKRDDGIYAKGAEEHFAWYLQKCQASKKGVETRKKNREANPGQPEDPFRSTGTPAPVNPLSLPPSLSLSLNTKNYSVGGEGANAPSLALVRSEKSELEKNEKTAGDLTAIRRSKLSDTTRLKMRSFIAAYAEGYKTKYGGPPEGIKDKAVVGKLGHWIEHVAEVRAIDLVKVYLQIAYRPFDESYHDLWQFFRHLNRIGIALDTGTDSNMTDWSKVFAEAR